MLPKEKNLDPRSKRTRQLLVQALMELLAEKDFHSITVQDITSRATVNRATFYAHFVDKYELINYSLREAFQQQLNNSRLSPTSEVTADNLRLLILTVFEFLAHFHSKCPPNPRSDKAFEPLLEAQIQIQLHEFLLDWLKQLPPTKTFRVATPEIAAATISWAIFGMGLEWGREQKLHTVEETVDQVLALLTEGLFSTNALSHPALRLPASIPIPNGTALKARS